MFDFDILNAGEFLIVKHSGYDWNKIENLASELGFTVTLNNHFNIIFRHPVLVEHHKLLPLFKSLHDTYLIWHRAVVKTKIPMLDFWEEW